MKTALNEKIKVLVILGPTSSGKSALAVKIAQKFGGEIISADSRQVFRDMDLGTGKVSGTWKEDPHGKKIFLFENIPHHLIDFRSPRGSYNVAQFQKDARRLIRQIVDRKKIPILCGGTGFWIDAVTRNLSLPSVPPDPSLRKRLKGKTAQQLFDLLEKMDAVRARTIDRKNPVRLVRAIEICKALGSVPAPRKKESVSEYDVLSIGLDFPQAILDEKISKRLDDRRADGMTEEVRSLRKKYRLSWKKIQSFGLGYFWIPLFLQKKIPLEELKEKVFLAERGYAKRQRTWFKRDSSIIWETEEKKSSPWPTLT